MSKLMLGVMLALLRERSPLASMIPLSSPDKRAALARRCLKSLRMIGFVLVLPAASLSWLRSGFRVLLS